MNYDEKCEFLIYAKRLAKDLEHKTNEFIEIQIGWLDSWQSSESDMPVTIMLNHKTRWFGDFEPNGWNENVIFDNIDKFVPVKEDYLILNQLIDEVYK